MLQRLDPAQAADRLASLPQWTVSPEGDALTRSFKFLDFAVAFGFMARVAILAERADHHPEWSNIYNRVDIRLTTHDVAGLSDRDFALAAEIDSAL